jgi:hypothetical protein
MSLCGDMQTWNRGSLSRAASTGAVEGFFSRPVTATRTRSLIVVSRQSFTLQPLHLQDQALITMVLRKTRTREIQFESSQMPGGCRLLPLRKFLP